MYLLYLQGYKQSFLSLNHLYFPIGDAVFPHLTHLADGVLLTVIVALFYTRKDTAWVLTMAFGLLFMAVTVSILKFNVFPTWNRPPLIFDKLQIHYITNQNECCNTFPSGHSATAACMFTFFAFQWEKSRKYYGIFAAFTTILLGYSRIYIGVHFLGDVLFGSLVGFLIALGCLSLVYPFVTKKLTLFSPPVLKHFDSGLRLIAVLLLLFDIIRIANIYIA